MRYQRVHIQALAYAVPPVEVSTRELEQRLAPLFRRIGVPDGVVQALTGVSSRRFWPDGRSQAEGASEVARRLVEEHGVPPGGIQALVSTSVSKDFLEPP